MELLELELMKNVGMSILPSAFSMTLDAPPPHTTRTTSSIGSSLVETAADVIAQGTAHLVVDQNSIPVADEGTHLDDAVIPGGFYDLDTGLRCEPVSEKSVDRTADSIRHGRELTLINEFLQKTDGLG